MIKISLKNRQGVRLCGVFMFRNCVNFSVLRAIRPTPAPRGEIGREGVDQ